MRKLIYATGLIFALIVVGLLLFLTLNNVLSNQAFFGARNGEVFIQGGPSALVNAGILGLACGLLAYIGYLFKRTSLWMKCYSILMLAGSALVAVGLIVSWLL